MNILYQAFKNAAATNDLLLEFGLLNCSTIKDLAEIQ